MKTHNIVQNEETQHFIHVTSTNLSINVTITEMPNAFNMTDKFPRTG